MTRHPAFSLDAEQAVLGGMMVDDRGYWFVADMLTEADFYRGDHRTIFRAIADLSRENKPCDAVTLGEWFEQQGVGTFGDEKAPAYVIRLANATPSAANIRAYGEIVANKAEQRRVADAGARIQQLSGPTAYADAQEILSKVSTGKAAGSQTAKEVMRGVLADMQAQCDRTSEFTGISTGFPMLDDMTAGLQRGDMVLVAGRPSMGKSLLAMQFAYTAARNGHPAHILSLEMPARACVLRMIAAIAGVPFELVRDAKRIEDHHWPKINAAAEVIAKLPLHFDDGAYDLPSICARVRQIHMQHKTELFVVDYLSHMVMPKADNTTQAMQVITREFKRTAKALNMVAIPISQLNRECEARADKRPILSDLRDSGAIEQDADVVLMPYRDGYYNPESPHRDYAEILVRKQRNGRTGMVPLLARLDEQRFDPAPEGLPAVVQESAPRFGAYRSRSARGGAE